MLSEKTGVLGMMFRTPAERLIDNVGKLLAHRSAAKPFMEPTFSRVAPPRIYFRVGSLTCCDLLPVLLCGLSYWNVAMNMIQSHIEQVAASCVAISELPLVTILTMGFCSPLTCVGSPHQRYSQMLSYSLTI